jgi:hypothetical protein
MKGTQKTSAKTSFFLQVLRFVACLAIGFQIYILIFLADGNSASNNFAQPGHDKIPQRNATATVAYAISLIKCGDKQSNDAGLVDAALVMRHSIHKISIRNPRSQSSYDYKMYALVHKQAAPCSHVLKKAGFHVVIIEESPVQPNEIRGEYLRNNIELEWCCGSAEFIKLYATTLPEPIVVHTDIDFVFLKPMDDLFDAILFPKDSPRGKAARTNIPLERRDEVLPDRIDAFITRDWPQVRTTMST